MKAKVYILALLFVSGYNDMFGQCSPMNSSFETWSSQTDTCIFGNLVTISLPDEWVSIAYVFGSVFCDSTVVVEQTSDAYSMASAAKLNADTMNAVDLISIQACSTTIPGVEGYYKFNGAATDTFIVMAFAVDSGAMDFLFSGDTSTAIGFGAFVSTGTTSNYTKFSFNMNYKSTDPFDSLIVFVTAINGGTTGPVSGWVDDVTTIGFVGTNELPMENPGFKVYPSPMNSSGIIELEIGSPADIVLELFDVLGARRATLINACMSGNVNIPLEINELNLSDGMYFLRLNSGGFVQSKRILVAR